MLRKKLSDRMTYHSRLIRATKKVARSLRFRDHVFFFAGVLFSLIVCAVVITIQSQPLIIRVFGSLFVIFLLFMSVFLMPRFIRVYGQHVRPAIESKYLSNKLHEVPLIITLTGIRADKPNNFRLLLKRDDPLVKKAEIDIKGSFDNSDTVIMTYTGRKGLVPRSLARLEFFTRLDSYFRDIIDAPITGEFSAGLCLTGEFGHLRDQEFLNSCENLPDKQNYALYGYHNQRPPILNQILDEASKAAVEDNEPEHRHIGSNKKTQIRSLFRSGKLRLYAYERKLRTPHLALIGNSVFVQQYHKHNRPSMMLQIKTPSDELVAFVTAYLRELRERGTVVPVEEE